MNTSIELITAQEILDSREIRLLKLKLYWLMELGPRCRSIWRLYRRSRSIGTA